MDPLGLVVLALWMAAAGLVASILVSGGRGRRVGFAALALAAAISGTGAIRGLVATQAWVAGSAALHVTVRLDPLASFFVLLLSAVALTVGLYGLSGRNADERRTGRTAAAAVCAILAASLLICLADDVLLFLFAWELLALAFYWAIAHAGLDETGPRAAYLALLVTHAAGAALVAGLLLAARTGGFSLSAALADVARAPRPLEDAFFVLVLIGFGAKVGMFPMHAWLRYGYPAAPSSVAALMAGGALNVGFYGIARFVVEPFRSDPVWWGVLVLVLGALGAFLGIVWAMSEDDMRALAAYSSVENAGIILAALGAALVGRAVHLPLLVGIGLAAAFLQITAHALAKALLFLACASVRNAVGTTAFAYLGGLSRRYRLLTICVLIAALSLAALPPTAGYLGEWTTLETLMQAFRTGTVAAEVAFALSGATIGIAAGVAIVAFVKLVGTGFLGAARRDAEADRPQAGGGRIAGVGLLAAAILAVGVFSPQYLRLIGPAVDATARASVVTAILASPPLVQPAFSGFSSTAPGPLILVILGGTAAFWLVSRLFRRPARRVVPAWTSGESYRSWATYTGTGFANPSRVILDAVARVERLITHTGGKREPEAVTYISRPRPFFGLPFYDGVASVFVAVSAAVRATQSGVIAAYLSYILVFTILLLLLYPSMRHW